MNNRETWSAQLTSTLIDIQVYFCKSYSVSCHINNWHTKYWCLTNAYFHKRHFPLDLGNAYALRKRLAFCHITRNQLKRFHQETQHSASSIHIMHFREWKVMTVGLEKSDILITKKVLRKTTSVSTSSLKCPIQELRKNKKKIIYVIHWHTVLQHKSHLSYLSW